MSIRLPDIPPEILDVVFDLAGVTNESPSVRIALASACKTWRDAIYSNPRYWATLRCSVRSDIVSTDEQLVKYMKQWFSRAGSLPLTLDLATGHSTTRNVPTHLVAFIVQNSRWEELKFSISWKLGCTDVREAPWLWELFKCAGKQSLTSGVACWGSLRALKIQSWSNVEANVFRLRLAAPLLESFQLHIKESRETAWVQDSLNWKSLRHFDLDGHITQKYDWQPAAGFYFSLLSRATRLESIRVKGDCLDGPYIPSPPKTGIPLPISVNHLSSLQFVDSPFTRHMITQFVTSCPRFARTTQPRHFLSLAPVPGVRDHTIGSPIQLRSTETSHQVRRHDD